MQLLSFEELEARGIRLTRYSLWRLAKEKRFPAPVKIGGRNMWIAREIDAYIEQRIAERDQQHAA